MAALSTSDRTKIWKALMRYWSRLPTGDSDRTVSASKYELYDPNANTGMIADLDNWLDTHSGNTTVDNIGINGAINTSYRSKFTTGQKGVTVAAIALARTGNIELLRSAFGDID